MFISFCFSLEKRGMRASVSQFVKLIKAWNSLDYTMSHVLRHSVVSDSLQSHGLEPTRLLCPWGFSRQEYWSGLPCPPPGDPPNPGIEPRSLTLQADSLPAEPHKHPKILLSLPARSHLAQKFSLERITSFSDAPLWYSLCQASSKKRWRSLYLERFRAFYFNICL